MDNLDELEFLITKEWLLSVCDDKGLTKGQRELLDIWCKGDAYLDKQIPLLVAKFIEQCKGYRPTYADITKFRNY